MSYVSYIHVDATINGQLDTNSKNNYFIGYGDCELVTVFRIAKLEKLSEVRMWICIKTKQLQIQGAHKQMMRSLRGFSWGIFLRFQQILLKLKIKKM